jgi:hypothetical protein
MAHDRLWNLTGFCGVHLLSVGEVFLVRLTATIVMWEHLTHLPKHLQGVGTGTVGAADGTDVERGDLASEGTVRVARGEIDDDTILQVRTLVGIKRVGITKRTGVVLEDNDVLIFHKFIPPKIVTYISI